MADSYIKTTNELARGITGDGLILDVNNGQIGNADTSYTYFYLNAQGYDEFSLSFVIAATTLTIEGSNDILSVSDSSAVWVDLTSMLTAGVASSFTATGSYTTNASIPWSRMRIKRVTTNATNALELRLTRMRGGSL
ncbi:MAG: hypothetical protein SFW66_08860 [Gammaproteobacteria bacterium]|nr:hypothetical protein [Gammaproteobacteria bacterium]